MCPEHVIFLAPPPQTPTAQDSKQGTAAALLSTHGSGDDGATMEEEYSTPAEAAASRWARTILCAARALRRKQKDIPRWMKYALPWQYYAPLIAPLRAQTWGTGQFLRP